MMKAADFIEQYENALGTQTWNAIAPMISENASVIFSDGSIHKGKSAIRAAYERNFEAIQNEDYRIENVHWLLTTQDCAVYMFDFFWTGIVRGAEASGSGRGTAVLVRKDDQWVLVAEQLGSRPRK